MVCSFFPVVYPHFFSPPPPPFEYLHHLFLHLFTLFSNLEKVTMVIGVYSHTHSSFRGIFFSVGGGGGQFSFLVSYILLTFAFSSSSHPGHIHTCNEVGEGITGARIWRHHHHPSWQQSRSGPRTQSRGRRGEKL